MPDPTEKAILLTGASSGIGAALARELAKKGHRLALTARRAERLEALAEECSGLGPEVVAIPADLGEIESASRLVDETVRAFGRLDVLVNNAGYGLSAPFGEVDPDDIVRQFDVNLVTPILLARHALPHLIASRGTILNVGSSLSTIAVPGFGVYGTTKAGMAYWNDALRREVAGRGVRVCLVEPGPVRTEFFGAAMGSGEAEGTWEMRPPAALSASAEDAARRIARLVDRPRRRISVLRRVVWPMRALGGIFRVFPSLGDAALAGFARSRAGR